MINFGAGLAKIAGIVKVGAGLPAIATLIVAAAVGTYFVAPQVFKGAEETGSQPAQVSGLIGGNSTTETAPASETPAAASDTLVASVDPGALSGPDSWIVPSFDLLRVEPDGSTVIAGKAEPGTMLDIMNGETVIASTEVGPSGDFAAVLDTPLAAGDYQLTLRIAGEDGASRVSEEVATVSIPKDAGGELLAMVSKPGKASRIIAQPAAPAEVAAAEPAAPATAAAPQVVETPAVAVEPADSTQADPAAIVASDAPATVDTPELPAASSLLTTSAPDIAVEDAGAVDAAPDQATEVATATPETAAETAAPALPAGANVRVDAVEIEGDRIFVAGSALPGYPVRVSADGVVIGTEKADETGRFIIEATSELAVGDHIISADLLDSAGQEVMLRATVPFNRPEGESLAAVAPPEPVVAEAAPVEPAPAETPSAGTPSAETPTAETPPAETPAEAATGELILPDIASLSQLREESFEALSALEQLVSAPDAPDAAEVSAAFETAVAKLKAAATAELPADSSSEAMEIAKSMRAQAKAALAVILPGTDQESASAADQAQTPDGGELIADLGRTRDMLKQAGTALSQPADMALAAANAPQPVADAAAQSTEPRTIVQAPLASTPGAVIIRRGDTLWQISRRTYGQGVRYTTIYVANRSQIQDPDRIKPGQVFSVPDSPLENAEELHKQLRDTRKKL